MSVILPAIDRKLLIKSQLQAAFDAIESGAMVPGDMEKFAIGYRNLNTVPKFMLRTKMDPLELSPVVQDGSWYPMLGKYCRHNANILSANNYDASNQPVLEVRGAAYMVGAGTAPQPTHVCIGISEDGLTWTHVAESVRPFGFGKGTSYPYYDSPSQNHYLTGAPGYFPVNYPYDQAVMVYGMFGGDAGYADVGTYKYYTLMFNGVLSDTCNGFAWLTLNARGDKS